MQNTKNAFTLAEVLITLGIIGVVAALTMPSLIANYQKQAAVTKLKKSYNILSNALLHAQVDHGEPKTWTLNGVDIKTNSEQLADILKPYLKIVKDCGSDGGCFKDGNAYQINGTATGTNYGGASDFYAFILSDGTSVILDANPSSSARSIYFDIDGPAGVNMFGKDLFIFVLQDNKFIPYGYDNEETVGTNCSKTGAGTMCAAKIMSDGWKIKDDYPW